MHRGPTQTLLGIRRSPAQRTTAGLYSSRCYEAGRLITLPLLPNGRHMSSKVIRACKYYYLFGIPRPPTNTAAAQRKKGKPSVCLPNCLLIPSPPLPPGRKQIGRQAEGEDHKKQRLLCRSEAMAQVIMKQTYLRQYVVTRDTCARAVGDKPATCVTYLAMISTAPLSGITSLPPNALKFTHFYSNKIYTNVFCFIQMKYKIYG